MKHGSALILPFVPCGKYHHGHWPSRTLGHLELAWRVVDIDPRVSTSNQSAAINNEYFTQQSLRWCDIASRTASGRSREASELLASKMGSQHLASHSSQWLRGLNRLTFTRWDMPAIWRWLATWFMLREIEMAAARAAHLRIDSYETFILIPTYKTDSFGKLTERSLKCTCRVQTHPMCPYHAASRHLDRLSLLQGFSDPHKFPLFPENDGSTPTKNSMVAAIRSVIAATGQSLERPDANGQMLQRFGGHSLRVAGAQLLAASGVPLQLIQLLGRWTSMAIQRYTQESALAVVPDVPTQVLRGHDPFLSPAWCGGFLIGYLSTSTGAISTSGDAFECCIIDFQVGSCLH